MSLSQYIDSIKPEDRFIYGIVFVSCIWFFSHAFKADVSFLIAIIFSFIIIYYRNDRIQTSTVSTNNDLELRLHGLLLEEKKPSPRYFHIDPDMILFFDSIKDFRIYNRDSYVRSIRTTDNLLKIRRELEYDFFQTQEKELDSWQNFELHGNLSQKKIVSNIKNHRELFQASEMLAVKGLNYLHSFIVNLPANDFYKRKHKEALDRYHILIRRNLDIILEHCQKYSDNPLIGVDYGKAKPANYKQGGLESSFEFF